MRNRQTRRSRSPRAGNAGSITPGYGGHGRSRQAGPLRARRDTASRCRRRCPGLVRGLVLAASQVSCLGCLEIPAEEHDPASHDAAVTRLDPFSYRTAPSGQARLVGRRVRLVRPHRCYSWKRRPVAALLFLLSCEVQLSESLLSCLDHT